MSRLLVAAVTAALLLSSAPALAQDIEGYAGYQPQTKCSPKAKAGTKVLARWIVRNQGGGYGPISRKCRIGGTSEHKEGRAFDWMLDADRKRDRVRARELLTLVRKQDRAGNADARARRMGIMYIIWNDHMYASWNEFAKEDYLSSSCKKRKKCSKTLRHRDHMHISLSRPGGKGRTSWYDGRLG
ncbi:hypothetical protein [Nocardioides coralli]|uniref:hypothetical protein n=1 Tax=Nocardioides coralli TaxID=2872154 RepID=UPI001CA43D01|nr:hypothetical protein [Nocardioides coralli]QZY29563.1 hypothetical protein K6T13_02390 [Nocardioides coralli]